MTEAARLVVFAIGNESRGDDALGPLLARTLEARLPPDAVMVADFQLQIEHALDLADAELALFVDAACGLEHPFMFAELAPEQAGQVFSHALSPAQLLGVHARVMGASAPPAFVLGMRAEQFELGAELSPQAVGALRSAEAFALALLREPDPQAWRARAAAQAVMDGNSTEMKLARLSSALSRSPLN